MIKLDKLRTQYKEFKDRRQLLSQFDLFLADDRILPMLTTALGKTFLKAKKQPVPIRLERRSSLAMQIARARDSAFLVGSYGDCWAVKLANTAMTEDQVVENLMAGIAAVVEKIPRKWKNIKAINIKCSSSVALPVYSNIGDLPPAPPAKKVKPAEEKGKGKRRNGKETKGNGKAETKEESDGGEKSGVGDHKKQRKPRPLIRQQLNKLKEEAKAEKAKAATTAAAEESKAEKAVVGVKRKKRAASENDEPNKSTAGGGEAEDSGLEAAGGKKVQRKAKSPKAKAKSPKAEETDGSAVKAAKRRRTAAA